MIIIKQQTNVQGGGYMKKPYANPELEIMLLQRRDVVTASEPDPDADNDVTQDDMFG